MTQTFVVVGAGLAAAKAVEELREAGFEGAVVVFGDEHHLPYERPPLSKGYLLGNDELETAFVHDPDWYDENDVDLRLGQQRHLDRHWPPTSCTPVTGSSPTTGCCWPPASTPRHLAMADESGAPVAYLRTIEDSQRLKESFAEGAPVVVIGAGWIGLEVAAAAARRPAPRSPCWSRSTCRCCGCSARRWPQVFADLHREHGVDLRTGVQVAAVEEDGDRAVRAASADGGTRRPPTCWSSASASSPNVALAEAAGLATDNGVLVDERLRHLRPGRLRRRRRRQRPAPGARAADPGRALGHRDRAGRGRRARDARATTSAYDRLPYFFTDQYDLGMEYVGSVGPDGYDEVVLRGDTRRPGAHVHGVLAPGGPGAGGDARQRLGRERPPARHRRPARSAPTGSATSRSPLEELAKG